MVRFVGIRRFKGPRLSGRWSSRVGRRWCGHRHPSSRAAAQCLSKRLSDGEHRARHLNTVGGR